VGAADELAGLEVGPRRDGAGVDDVDISRFIEADDAMAAPVIASIIPADSH